MGARLRLENNPTVDALIASMGPEAQIIATAMQQYGLILADDGSPMYVTGSSGSVDANNSLQYVWNMNDVLGLESLTSGDFQVIDLTPVVTGISASTGSAGNIITITGQNFSGASGQLSVFFGADQSKTVTIVGDTEITAVVPSGSGTVDVTVQSGQNEQDNNSSNPNANATAPIFGYGTSATSAADQFTYVTQTVSPSNSSVSFASPTDMTGTSDLVTFVIKDTNDNAVSGLPGSAFNPALSGGTSAGSFGTVTETSTPGTYSATFTGSTVGTPSTLTVTVTGVQLDSQPTVQVAADQVSGSNSTVSFASSTVPRGANDIVTIVVKDAAGSVMTGLASSVFNLTLSGGTSTGLFGAVSETATHGTYTATFTGAIAGTAGILILDINNVPVAAEPNVTVLKGGVDPNNSTVSFATSTVASGTTDKVTIVVEDAGGNPLGGLASTAFALSLSGGTSTGVLSAVTPTTTLGTYAATLTGVKSGTPTSLTLKINGLTISAKPTVQVVPGAANPSRSTVSVAATTLLSGRTDLVTISLKDANNNVISGLHSSDFTFGFTGGKSTGKFGTISETSTPGTYTVLLTGVTNGTASTLTVKVDGVLLATEPKIAVKAGSISPTNSTVNFANPTVAVGGTVIVTIAVINTAGNGISGLLSSEFVFTLFGGTSKGAFGKAIETSTPGVYTVVFKGVTAGTASKLKVVVAGVALTNEPTIQVT